MKGSFSKNKVTFFLWFGFAASALLTWTAYASLWYLSSYFTILWCLAAIQFVLGLSLMVTTRFALRTGIFVLTGIIVGQKWLTMTGIAFLLWSINGFAP